VEAILIGMGLVFTVLLYALTAMRMPESSQYLAYDIEGGHRQHQPEGGRKFPGPHGGEFAAVEALEPTLRAGKGALQVQLDVKVKAGAQIPELCRMLQERARATIRDKVGISDVQEVRVRVQEITGTTASSETNHGDVRPESFS
jgi:hypothetical protein